MDGGGSGLWPGAALSHRSAGTVGDSCRDRRDSPEVIRAGGLACASRRHGSSLGLPDGRDRDCRRDSSHLRLPDAVRSGAVLPKRGLERAMNEAEVQRLTGRLSLPHLLDRYPGRRGTKVLREYWRRRPGGITRNDFEERFVEFLDAMSCRGRGSTRRWRCAGGFFEVDCMWRSRGWSWSSTAGPCTGPDGPSRATGSGTGFCWSRGGGDPGHLAAAAGRTGGDRCGSARTCCAAVGATSYSVGMERELFEHYLSDESRRGPAADGRLHRRGRWRRLRRPLADLAVRSRRRASLRSASTPRAAARPRRRPRPSRRWSTGRRCWRRRRSTSTTVDAAIGGSDAGQAARCRSPPMPCTARSTRCRIGAPSQLACLGAGVGDRASEAVAAPVLKPGERVAVAMSGGVDSAVAALLERERGADVVGVTVKLWADPETDGAKACCSPEAVLGARALAHSLGIPHFTLDLEEEFRRRVVGRFVSGYAEGSTPNPCVLCNGEVRIAAMVDLAERLGADRLDHRPLRPHRRGRRRAAAGLRRRRGQGPELHAGGAAAGAARPARLPADRADQARGAGDRRPPRARRSRRSRRARTSASSPARASASFLRRHGGLADSDGAVLDRAGRAVGRHRGHHNFTVGQRRGIGVSAPEPLYVVATDAVANTVTVGTRAELETRRVTSATRSCTATAPASTRSACATTRAPCQPRSAPPAPAATTRSRSSWARSSSAPLRVRRRCCWKARRSSATARSPPRPDGSTRPAVGRPFRQRNI